MIYKEKLAGGIIKGQPNLIAEVIIEDVSNPDPYIQITSAPMAEWLWDWYIMPFPLWWVESGNRTQITFTLPDTPWKQTDGLTYLVNIDLGLYLTSSDPINTEPEQGGATLTFSRSDQDSSYMIKFLDELYKKGNVINFWLGSKPDWL